MIIYLVIWTDKFGYHILGAYRTLRSAIKRMEEFVHDSGGWEWVSEEFYTKEESEEVKIATTHLFY